MKQNELNQTPALSIQQPWAELILDNRKTIEIRSWATDYRGKLWIHTGLKHNTELEKHFGFKDLFHGGFVGSVTLKAVVPLDHSRWELWYPKHLDTGKYQPGFYAWILDLPSRFSQPVASTGKTGLFYPTPSLQTHLQRASVPLEDPT